MNKCVAELWGLSLSDSEFRGIRVSDQSAGKRMCRVNNMYLLMISVYYRNNKI